MVNQVKSPDEKVTGAQATDRGLFLHVGDFWPRVDGKEKLLDNGIVILLDTSESGEHFSEEYLAHYDGDPADSIPPTDCPGATTDPVAVCLTEQWLASLPTGVGNTVDFDVPTPEQARAEIPGLRDARHAKFAA